MAYQVVSAVIEGAIEPAEPETVQLDAPDGMFVASAYWGVVGGDGYHLDAPSGSRPLIDSEGRLTGVVFTGAGSIEGVTSDLEVAIVCVS